MMFVHECKEKAALVVQVLQKYQPPALLKKSKKQQNSSRFVSNSWSICSHGPEDADQW
jgi:hypothetical protein